MSSHGPPECDAKSGGDGHSNVERRDAGQHKAESVGEASGAFVQLLTKHQHRIRAYLIAMVASDQEADDLLQETNMTLWNKRDAYDPARPFFSWACGVAYIEIMRSRRRVSTEKLRFDVALLESISEEFVRQGDLLDDRQESLRKCLDRLDADERRLIQARYSGGWSISELATAMGKQPKTVYGTLARIRESLYQCIERSISHGQHPRLS